jgi:hypothetical protein
MKLDFPSLYCYSVVEGYDHGVKISGGMRNWRRNAYRKKVFIKLEVRRNIKTLRQEEQRKEEISDRKRKRPVQGKKEELGGWAEVSEHERLH